MVKREQKRTIDMTSGPLLKPLLFFILPLIGSGIFQQLYNTVDFIFIGNLLNKTSAAAVGAGSTLTFCFIGLFSGIAAGTTVVIANAFGAKDRNRAVIALDTSVIFCFFAGIILTVLGIIFAPAVLAMLNTPETAMAEAVVYFRVYMLSIPAMIFYNTCSGAMRATGDAKTPFHILALCGFVNVAADAFFLMVIPLGVFGVAVATVIAQCLSAVLIFIAITKKSAPLRLDPRHLGFNAKILKKVLYVGLPTGLQTMLITVSNVMVQYYINGLGETAVAAFATYYRVENLLYLPILAFGQAAVAFAGQNDGAGQIRRIFKGANIMTLLCGGITVIVAGFILLFPDIVLRWFIRDDSVIAAATVIASVAFPFYWLNAFIEIYAGSLRGMNRALSPMFIIILNICAMRLFLLALFTHVNYVLSAIAAVYPLSWAGASLFLILAFILVIKKELRLHAQRESA